MKSFKEKKKSKEPKDMKKSIMEDVSQINQWNYYAFF